jgi:ParB family chromosome partitioning protein
MAQFYNDSIFWIEVEKIKPNPFQPRREFDENKLNDLARSIRQYGVIQPLTVTRHEFTKDDGGIGVEYELVAGERRLRASKLAGIVSVPAIIQDDFLDDKTKLEIAIIENLQREDLTALDRAKAFERLANEFGFKHVQIAEKVGKSREYVSNTLRLLMLPEEMQAALQEGKITEGHARPLLMLIEKPEEQNTLFREIMVKRLTVRDSESIARRIAVNRVRKKEYIFSNEILDMEKKLAEALGTRVVIEVKEKGGKLAIDFTGEEDLRELFRHLAANMSAPQNSMNMEQKRDEQNVLASSARPDGAGQDEENRGTFENHASAESLSENIEDLDDRTPEEKFKDENTFDPSSFSL